jgi:dipeptidyl aminopeptidase/acylaminoacyl peptidase
VHHEVAEPIADPAARAGGERSPVVADDLYRMRYAAGARIAADGRHVAFVCTSVARASDSYVSEICRIEVSSGRAQLLGTGVLPRFSPGSKELAWASGDQVLLSSLSDAPLARLPGAIRELAWSPDGRRLGCVVSLEDPARATSPVHRIRTARYKLDGLGLTYATSGQIFLVDPASGAVSATPEVAGGASSLCFAPDGARVAFVRELAGSTGGWDRELVVRSLGHADEDVAWQGIALQDVSWSPVGDVLAFRAGRHAYVPSMNLDVWSLRLGASAQLLSASLDRFVGNDRIITDTYLGFQSTVQVPVWTEGGTKLLFLVQGDGSGRIYEVVVGGGEPQALPLPEGGVGFDFDATPTGQVAAVCSTRERPTEVWLLPERRKLSSINDHWCNERRVAAPDRVAWPLEEDGLTGEGWLYRPPASTPSGSPLVVYVHGGPYRLHSYGFFHEVQALVGLGYRVWCPNPRGSQGYGERFAAAIDNDWGNLDFRDVMGSVDAVLEGEASDPPRALGVMGGSYGGFLVNWIVTHTDRFQAAVSDRSISNLLSYLGTADCAVSFGRFVFGRPWDAQETAQLLRQSPVAYAAQARTPTLLLHAMDDQVCPVEQGEQFFLALKDYGCETELVLIPGASHELPRSGPPSLRLERLRLIAEWFGDHLGQPGDADCPG